jgi:hypothetical protein
MSNRFKKNDGEMQISEQELSSMTSELDMLHKSTFPTVTQTLEDVSANLAHLRTSTPFGRRGFLAGVGGVALLGTVAACSSSGGGSSKSPSATAPATGGSSTAAATSSKYTGDLKVVALAAALENLAVAAYGLALSQAGKGTYGTVPPAVATFVTTAMGQHKDHAAAWNSVLVKNKLPKVTGTPLTIAAGAVKDLQGAKTIADVATQALGLENAAAETYTFATENVTDLGGVMVAATIQPVETMHAAILNFVLGKYPVPVSFIGTSNAVQPAMFTG